MKVMMFGKATKQSEASQPPTEEALLAMHKFNEELEKAGVLLDLGGLTPTSRGVRVQYSGSKRTVIDGPFPENVPGEAEERAKRLGEQLGTA